MTTRMTEARLAEIREEPFLEHGHARALLAEVDALRAELVNLSLAWTARAEAAEARVKRLRLCLAGILDGEYQNKIHPDQVEAARAALSESE